MAETRRKNLAGDAARVSSILQMGGLSVVYRRLPVQEINCLLPVGDKELWVRYR